MEKTINPELISCYHVVELFAKYYPDTYETPPELLMELIERICHKDPNFQVIECEMCELKMVVESGKINKDTVVLCRGCWESGEVEGDIIETRVLRSFSKVLAERVAEDLR